MTCARYNDTCQVQRRLRSPYLPFHAPPLVVFHTTRGGCTSPLFQGVVNPLMHPFSFLDEHNKYCTCNFFHLWLLPLAAPVEDRSSRAAVRMSSMYRHSYT